jgi:hypothetical protein
MRIWGGLGASFGVLGSIQSARDDKSVHRIGEHSWSYFGLERIGEGHL